MQRSWKTTSPPGEALAEGRASCRSYFTHKGTKQFLEGITICDIDIEAGDDGQLFLHLGPEKRVGFGSPVDTKRW